MAAEHDLIISAIEGLRTDVNQRFVEAAAGMADMKKDIVDTLNDHETRITENTATLIRYRTVGGIISGVAAFVGWDSIRHHWTSLVK